MLSIQEMAENSQLKRNLKETEQYMEKWRCFDAEECNIYRGLRKSLASELSETLRRTPLKEYATSTVLSTGSLGAAGLNYLVPTWITTQLHVALSETDVAPLIAGLYTADQSGDLVTFNAIAKAAVTQSMGGEGAGGGITASMSRSYMNRFAHPFVVTNEMIEDNQYGLIEQAIKAAQVQLTKDSNKDVIRVLIRTSGTTGYGAKQALTAGDDTTTPANVGTICAETACPSIYGTYIPDTLVCPPETWWDAIATTAGHPEIMPATGGYVCKYGPLNVVFINDASLGTVASDRITNCQTIVLEKQSALGVARKNWMRIENYSDPVNDLAGAVLTGKQAVAELSCAAIGIITEA